MIEINIPSPNLKRIIEKTLAIVNDTYALENTEEQLLMVAKALEEEFKDKMITTVWSIDDFTPFLDLYKELSFDRKVLIARRAMRLAENDFDPDIGLYWAAIKSYVDDAKYQIELDEQADAQQNKAK